MAENILICGVGGQGTVLAAKVLSQAAISSGEHVLSAETIGMAQRGGSVTSHVRIGRNLYSPLIPKGQANMIIAFEAAEAVRNIDYLKKDGMIIVNKKVVQPTTASLTGKTFSEDIMLEYLEKQGKVISVDTEAACKELGSSKVVNMVLLGAACKTGLITREELKAALKLLVKPDFYELNCNAIDYVK
ncbi:MAG: indolepyruvate oxidoreductase subunit beta [Treponema sp.]|nr:indolepyruvate oxidoreductase subunit beta [Treponema sp.]